MCFEFRCEITNKNWNSDKIIVEFYQKKRMSETFENDRKWFGGNSGGNADVYVGEKCRRHVGNMSERKMIENQYVIVLWGVCYQQ